jgi:hypothetical protein
MYEHFDLIINLDIKVKHANFLYIHSRNCDECKMQSVNNGSNKFKVNDSIHVQMLIVQKMRILKLLHVF